MRNESRELDLVQDAQQKNPSHSMKEKIEESRGSHKER